MYEIFMMKRNFIVLYFIYNKMSYNKKYTMCKKILRKKQMFLNQGTSQPEASQQEVNGDMASWEELVELDDVQLATVVGGVFTGWNGNHWGFGGETRQGEGDEYLVRVKQ